MQYQGLSTEIVLHISRIKSDTIEVQIENTFAF